MSATPSEARSIRFYFSFRSPYAWIAAERLQAELGDRGVPIERLAIFPTPELFPNDPSALPEKLAYLLQDVPRLARRHGLSVRFPAASDTDWALPHAAFLGTAAGERPPLVGAVVACGASGRVHRPRRDRRPAARERS